MLFNEKYSKIGIRNGSNKIGNLNTFTFCLVIKINSLAKSCCTIFYDSTLSSIFCFVVQKSFSCAKKYFISHCKNNDSYICQTQFWNKNPIIFSETNKKSSFIRATSVFPVAILKKFFLFLIS